MGEVAARRLRKLPITGDINRVSEVNSLATKYYQLLRLVKKDVDVCISPVLGRREWGYRGKHSLSPLNFKPRRSDSSEEGRKSTESLTPDRKRMGKLLANTPTSPIVYLEGTSLCRSPSSEKRDLSAARNRLSDHPPPLFPRDPHFLLSKQRRRRISDLSQASVLLERASNFRIYGKKRQESDYRVCQRINDGGKRLSPLPWSVQSSFDLNARGDGLKREV